jgi:hypothetical protein
MDRKLEGKFGGFLSDGINGSIIDSLYRIITYKTTPPPQK